MNILKLSLFSACKRNASRIFVSFQSTSAGDINKFVSVTENENSRTATITLQKPPVNSLSLEMLQQITNSIKELEKKKHIEGVILSSSCPNVFCAGLDIMEMYKVQENRFRHFWSAFQDVWKTLYSTPLITMAEINGHAPAGGCMLALTCDYRIMLNSNAKIGLNETMLGIIAPKWLQQMYIDILGFRKAETALSLGTLYTPEQALTLNLVNELASNSQELHAKIHQQMEVWLQIPVRARQMTKSNLREKRVKKMVSYANEELEMYLKALQNEQTQEALAEYVESLKRKK